MLYGILKRTPCCLMAAAILLMVSAVPAFAQPDQEKLFYDATNGYILYFDDADSDGFHDPGEDCNAGPSGAYIWLPDNSCWMASTSNMLVSAGIGNPYMGWIENGAAPSPNTDPWGNPSSDDANGGSFTFDDGGYQHWALETMGIPYKGPIITTDKFVDGTWAIDPVEWCKARIAEGFTVGLAVYGGDPKLSANPGRMEPDKGWFYHAITLYSIDDVNNKIIITDSDDQVNGTKEYSSSCVGNDWTITNFYGYTAHVNYAVTLTRAKVPSVSTWGLIVLTILVLLCGAYTMRRFRGAKSLG